MFNTEKNMKAKLIKDSDGYWLDISNDVITKRPLTDFGQLSIKNCDAIANGYNLDELAEEKYHGHVMAIDWQLEKRGFITGFQKALSILGDKKFDMNDIALSFRAGIEHGLNPKKPNTTEYVQSLQTKEWDVEICCYLGNGDKESDSFKDTFVTNTGIPKLDSDGCLILRRK